MLKNMLIPLCFMILLPMPIYAKTVELRIENQLDYNFTKNYNLSFSNNSFFIDGKYIKPFISIFNNEQDLKNVFYTNIIKDNKYNYEFGFNINSLSLSNIDYVGFDLKGFKRLDDISFTDGKIRIIFDDLIEKGNMQIINDSRIMLYEPTTLIIDPTIQLLPNSTNKAYYNATYDVNCVNLFKYVNTEFSSANYVSVNSSNDVRFQQSAGGTGEKCNYYKFAFNLTGIDVSSITQLVFAHEGFYTCLNCVDSITELYFYNATSAAWVYWNNVDQNENTITKTFTTGIASLISNNIATFGIRLNKAFTDLLKTVAMGTDYAYVNVTYTTEQPAISMTKCEYLCRSDTLEYNLFIRNNDVLINQNNQVNLINLNNENLTNLDTNCLIFGDYKNNICINLNDNKAMYFKVI